MNERRDWRRKNKRHKQDFGVLMNEKQDWREGEGRASLCSLLKRPKHYKDRPVAVVAQAVSASPAADTPAEVDMKETWGGRNRSKHRSWIWLKKAFWDVGIDYLLRSPPALLSGFLRICTIETQWPAVHMGAFFLASGSWPPVFNLHQGGVAFYCTMDMYYWGPFS